MPRTLVHTLKLLLLPLLLLCGGQAQGQAVARPTLATLPDVAAALHSRAPLLMAAGSTPAYSYGRKSNGTDTTANASVPETAPAGGMTDISIVFCNPTTTPYTVTTSLEYPAGTLTPAFFGGQKSITIAPGGQALTDPIGLFVPGGAAYFVHDFVSVTAGNVWPTPAQINQIVGTNAGYLHGTTQTDQTANAAFNFSATASEYAFSHMGILARLPANRVSGLIVGDSIAYGIGDTNNWGFGGYIDDALLAAGIGRAKIAIPGEITSQLLAPAGAARLAFAKYATFAIDEYGVNDIAASHALAQLEADKITLWQELALRGLKVFACTLTPQSASTDSFATTANQTVSAQFGPGGTRCNYNDWLRAGAPVASTTNIVAVAPGTAGSVPCPYLTGYFETADAVESGRNTGKWAAQPAAISGTVTSTADLGAFHENITDTAGVFTAGMLAGAAISVSSGANAGRTNTGLIWTGPHSFTCPSMFGFAVGTPYTLTLAPLTADGIHPSPYGHFLASQSITIANLKL